MLCVVAFALLAVPALPFSVAAQGVDQVWALVVYIRELQAAARREQTGSPHADERSPGMTKIVRGKLAGERGKEEWVQAQTVFEAKREHYLPTDYHFGSRSPSRKRPAQGPPGATHYLFFALGERGRMEQAQDLGLPNGKTHRVWDDGTIPADNPFSAALASSGGYASIWTYGNRNPQGLTFDLEGNLWATEHGPRRGDELNLLLPGKNNGWPLVSYGINYNGAPFRTPWPDSSAGPIACRFFYLLPSIAVCGLDVVLNGPDKVIRLVRAE
jgi:hypothetical protein